MPSKNLPPDRVILESVMTPLLVIDREYRFVFVNPAYLRAFNKTWEEIEGRNVFDVFPDDPERRVEVSARFARALQGEHTRANVQAYRIADADGIVSEHYWQADEAPLFDADGQVSFIVQNIRDVSTEVKLRRQKDIINKELEHRLRNTLALVGSLAIVTGRNATDIDEFVEAFTDKLDAMSRNLMMISDNHWQGLSYRTIVESELAQVLPLDSPRLRLSGPDVVFSVRSTKWTALLAHELVKNALRYGCFSVPDGKLTLSWGVEDGLFVTEWIEEGCQAGANLDRRGFGTQMFELMPNMTTFRELRPEGLYLRTEAPASMLQTGPELSNTELIDESGIPKGSDE